MTRRKFEITGHINERDFPQIVELELPPDGFRSQASSLMPSIVSAASQRATTGGSFPPRDSGCPLSPSSRNHARINRSVASAILVIVFLNRFFKGD